MPHYVQSDGPSIAEKGAQAIREPHPVFLVQSDVPFSVSTNNGTMNGNAGDYIAHDPISGDVWPMSAEYVDTHYRWVETSDDENDDENYDKNDDENDDGTIPAPRSGENGEE